MSLSVSQAIFDDWTRRGLIDPATVRTVAIEEQAPAPDERQSEKDFMADVVKLAKQHHWRVYHAHDSRRSAKGFPDLVLCRGKRLIVCELKTAIGTTTPEQDEWLAALHGVPGIETYTWRPTNWPEIARALEGTT